MGYPIRFKLVPRDKGTGPVVKPTKGDNVTAILTPSGQPAIMRQDFYTYVEFVSCADYELHVATEKDPKGQWIYKKVGH